MVAIWVCVGLLLFAALLLGLFAYERHRRRNPYAGRYGQVYADLQRARQNASAVFYEASIQMDIAAGLRRPGERRVGDEVSARWKDW